MRNLFLLFFCIVFVLTMKQFNVPKKAPVVLPAQSAPVKEAPVKGEIKVLYIEKSQVIDFSGTLFVPRTIRLSQNSVKQKFIELTVQGKKYMYYPNFGQYYLKGESREVRVEKGDSVGLNSETGTVRFFFVREL